MSGAVVGAHAGGDHRQVAKGSVAENLLTPVNRGGSREVKNDGNNSRT